MRAWSICKASQNGQESKDRAVSPQDNGGLFLWRFSDENREKTIADQKQLRSIRTTEPIEAGRLTRLNITAK
jgi:hypothetical protein